MFSGLRTTAVAPVVAGPSVELVDDKCFSRETELSQRLRRQQQQQQMRRQRWTAPAEMRVLMRRPHSGAQPTASGTAVVGRHREPDEKRKSGPPQVPVDLLNSRFMRQSISNYVTQAADAQNNVLRVRQLCEDVRVAQLASLAASDTDDCAAAAARLECIMEDVGALANRIRLQLKLMEPNPGGVVAGRTPTPTPPDIASKLAAQRAQYQSVGESLHHALSRYYDLQCAYYKALQRSVRSHANAARARGGGAGYRADERRWLPPPDGGGGLDQFVADGPMVMAPPGPSGRVDVQTCLYEQEMRLHRVDAAVRQLHAAACSARRLRVSSSGGGSACADGADEQRRSCRPASGGGGGGGGAGGNAAAPAASCVDCLATEVAAAAVPAGGCGARDPLFCRETTAGYGGLATAAAAKERRGVPAVRAGEQRNWCKCALAFLFVFVLFCAIAAIVAATLLLVIEKRSAGS